MVNVVVVEKVEALVVVHSHCCRFCQRLGMWCGGWVVEEVKLT